MSEEVIESVGFDKELTDTVIGSNYKEITIHLTREQIMISETDNVMISDDLMHIQHKNKEVCIPLWKIEYVVVERIPEE